MTKDRDSGVTYAIGQVALDSNSVKNAKGTFTFTADGITKDGWTYDPIANLETCDSTTV
ncbi:MAG: hypothetical protein ACE5KE_06980 [Methanosarcinales archaeon]